MAKKKQSSQTTETERITALEQRFASARTLVITAVAALNVAVAVGLFQGWLLPYDDTPLRTRIVALEQQREADSNRITSLEQRQRELLQTIRDERNELVESLVNKLITEHLSGAKTFDTLSVKTLRANVVTVHGDPDNAGDAAIELGLSGKSGHPRLVMRRGANRAASLSVSEEAAALELHGPGKEDFGLVMTASADASTLRLAQRTSLGLAGFRNALGITLQYTEKDSDIYLNASSRAKGAARLRMQTFIPRDNSILLDQSLVLNAGFDSGWGSAWAGTMASSVFTQPHVQSSNYVDDKGHATLEFADPLKATPFWRQQHTPK